MLVAEAHVLDAIFNDLARRAIKAEYMDNLDRYLKLALRGAGAVQGDLGNVGDDAKPADGELCSPSERRPYSAGEQCPGHNGRRLPRAGKNESAKQNYWRRKMANGWTLERRARQAELIRQWRPWEKSTGPRTDAGKEAVSRKCLQGRHLATAARAVACAPRTEPTTGRISGRGTIQLVYRPGWQYIGITV